jgi:predicted nicotinamide N-methyase
MCRWLETQSVYPRDFLQGKRVLELGAGCGLVGMLAASPMLGAAQVVITDLDVVVPHIARNLAENVGPWLPADTVMADALAWGRESEWTDRFPCGSFDVVLLSDCLYHEHLFDPLMSTLMAVADVNTLVLLCQKHRWLHRYE